MYERGEVHAGFWWGNLRERDHFKDSGVDGRIMKWQFKKWEGGLDWIDLAQYSDRWQAVVNVVMNFQFP